MENTTTGSWFQAPTALFLGLAFFNTAALADPPSIPPRQLPGSGQAGGGAGPGPGGAGPGGQRPQGPPAAPILGDQEFVQIAPGYLLYAEKFYFSDANAKSGRAVGHVFIQLPPNFALLGVTFVHADTADFDVRMGWMVLRGWPEVLIGSTIHRAADETTRMRLTWLGTSRGLTTVGPETLETLRPGDIKGKVDDGGSGGP